METKIYKVLIVGDPGVGKTSITRRWLGEDFSETPRITVGADFSYHEFRFNDKVIKYQFWDLAGQDKSFEFSSQYVRFAAGIFFVFDMTHPTSLNSYYQWITNINMFLEREVPIVILANKLDAFKEAPVGTPWFQSLINLKVSHCFTSAKENSGLYNAREIMASAIFNREKELNATLSLKGAMTHNITATDVTNKEKSSCC